MLGKIEGRKKRGQQRMGWLDDIINSVDMNLNQFQEMVKDRKVGVLQCMWLQSVGQDLATNQQQQQLDDDPRCGSV